MALIIRNCIREPIYLLYECDGDFESLLKLQCRIADLILGNSWVWLKSSHADPYSEHWCPTLDWVWYASCRAHFSVKCQARFNLALTLEWMWMEHWRCMSAKWGGRHSISPWWQLDCWNPILKLNGQGSNLCSMSYFFGLTSKWNIEQPILILKFKFSMISKSSCYSHSNFCLSLKMNVNPDLYSCLILRSDACLWCQSRSLRKVWLYQTRLKLQSCEARQLRKTDDILYTQLSSGFCNFSPNAWELMRLALMVSTGIDRNSALAHSYFLRL